MTQPARALAASVLSLFIAACTATPPASSKDPRLTGLEVRATFGGSAEMSPAFSPNVFTYAVRVQSDITTVEVNPRVADSSTAVTINNSSTVPGSPSPVPVLIGDNVIRVTVTDTAGKVATYIVTVKREDIGPVVSNFKKLTFHDPANGITMEYRLFVPQPLDMTRSYPLVLFLHGAGESGSDNEIQLAANQGATVWAKPEEQAQHPCFVLAPQNPKDPTATDPKDFGRQGWTSLMRLGFRWPFEAEPSLRTAHAILQEVMVNYPVDPKRIYGTGLSMGGFGIFAMAVEYPGTFAAVVGVAGGLDPAKAPALAGTPVWVFHAAKDPVVPVQFSRNTVEAIQQAGGKPRYTEYGPEVFFSPNAHVSWIPAYASFELREWLFQQSK